MIKFWKEWFNPKPKYEPEPQLYAAKGEVVSCTTGHEVCELSRDVYIGDTVQSEQFTNWRNQKPPIAGDLIAPCQTCGHPFIMSQMPYGGSRLHIDGEWRTTKQDDTSERT